MNTFEQYEVWFVTGAQLLYGGDAVIAVDAHSNEMVKGLNDSGKLPVKVVYKGTVNSSKEVTATFKAANNDDKCIGVITWMHTFSPAKMWIHGLQELKKPLLHFHTQFNKEIPWETMDMDFMNLNQSAHGDREFGHIVTRMRKNRKVVVGHWQDEKAQNQIAAWMRVAAEEDKKATVFGYWVSDPERYGVAEFDKDGNCLSIEEKPQHPKSNYAVTGLYFYPNKVVEVAKSIKPSARGELEITSVNQRFLADGELKVQTLGRGFAWLDTGTHDSLAEASTYIEVIEKRQGLKVACLEGIAYRKGWITAEKMRELAQPMLKNQYGQYLLKVIDELKHTDKPNLD